MEEKVLTITIPSYNVEAYLEECLESFVNSEVMEEIEVLVVNDGSSDSTAEIAQRYADKYPETFRLINKENGGHGSTINTGIKEAKGKYFKVVDGDDWVDTRSFIRLVKVLKESEADIVASNYTWINHIDAMTKLRNGIYLRAYAQKNPLSEYTEEAFYMFEQMKLSIVDMISKNIVHMGIRPGSSAEESIPHLKLEVEFK